MSIRVAITDDHPLVIKGVVSMLSSFPEIIITDTYASGKELLEGLQREQPDVLLLDVLLPDITGKELAPIIAKQYPQIRMIALTSLDAPAMIKSMMQRGCIGYLLKDTDEATLVTAIHHAHRGEEFIEPSLKEQFFQNMIKHPKPDKDVLPELTLREKEILQLIAAEYTTQEIADKLFISFRTVENHRYNLLQKLDVKNTAGLVRMAMILGIVE